MFYQCFKTGDRTVYCSSRRYKTHEQGKEWVSACMQHFNIRANDMVGRPYESAAQPRNAVIWP